MDHGCAYVARAAIGKSLGYDSVFRRQPSLAVASRRKPVQKIFRPQREAGDGGEAAESHARRFRSS
jgi:hypothetical protein